LRIGKEIRKGIPKASEKSKEIPVGKDESGITKSNDIEANLTQASLIG
jgi:hypothetical protein